MSNWDTLGGQLNGNCYAIAIDSNNNVYVGGDFTIAGGVEVNRIAKWDASTSSWSALGGGLDSACRAIAIDSNNNVYVGGDFLYAYNSANNGSPVSVFRIAKWNPSSALWSNVGGLNGTCYAIAFDSNDHVFVVGDIDYAYNSYNPPIPVTVYRIAKWIPSSASWSALGGLGTSISICRAIAIASNNDVYAGGDFVYAYNRATQVAVYRIAKFSYSSTNNSFLWSALSGGLNGPCYAIAIDSNNNVYAGGDFTTATNDNNTTVTVNRIAKWDGSSWSALGGGLDGSCYAIAIDSNNNVYAGGDFIYAYDDAIEVSLVTVNRIAKWINSDSKWFNIGDSNNRVNAIAIDNNFVYANLTNTTTSIKYIAYAHDTNFPDQKYAVFPYVRIKNIQFQNGLNDTNANANANAISIGSGAGFFLQNISAIAIGIRSGQYNQGTYSISIGNNTGQYVQCSQAIAIGYNAGKYVQHSQAIAIGYNAGQKYQNSKAIAIGYQAGQYNQGLNSISIGYQAGQTNQGMRAIAIGYFSGNIAQGLQTIAIGFAAGRNTQGTQAIAIGVDSGEDRQMANAIAIGYQAGQSNQMANAVAIGYQAGHSNQGINAVAIGVRAGKAEQGSNAVAIGFRSNGPSVQHSKTVAIGYQAGQSNQQENAVTIGTNSGLDSQRSNAIAIGGNAGKSNQQQHSIAIGTNAGENTQGNYAIAIGRNAGENTQGNYAIAIGSLAGQTNQPSNSIIINASGMAVSPTATFANATYISPIRNTTNLTNTNIKYLEYDTTTKEVTYNNNKQYYNSITILKNSTYIYSNHGITNLYNTGAHISYFGSNFITTQSPNNAFPISTNNTNPFNHNVADNFIYVTSNLPKYTNNTVASSLFEIQFVNWTSTTSGTDQRLTQFYCKLVIFPNKLFDLYTSNYNDKCRLTNSINNNSNFSMTDTTYAPNGRWFWVYEMRTQTAKNNTNSNNTPTLDPYGFIIPKKNGFFIVFRAVYSNYQYSFRCLDASDMVSNNYYWKIMSSVSTYNLLFHYTFESGTLNSVKYKNIIDNNESLQVYFNNNNDYINIGFSNGTASLYLSSGSRCTININRDITSASTIFYKFWCSFEETNDTETNWLHINNTNPQYNTYLKCKKISGIPRLWLQFHGGYISDYFYPIASSWNSLAIVKIQFPDPYVDIYLNGNIVSDVLLYKDYYVVSKENTVSLSFDPHGGSVDDFRIYSRTLSASEIAFLHDNYF